MQILDKLASVERSFWSWYNRPVDVNSPMPDPPGDDAILAFFCVFVPALIAGSFCISRCL